MKAKYALRVGKRPEMIPLERVEDASDFCADLRKKLNVGASKFPRLTVVDSVTWQTVAHVSYNGRIWGPDNVAPYVSTEATRG